MSNSKICSSFLAMDDDGIIILILSGCDRLGPDLSYSKWSFLSFESHPVQFPMQN